MTAPIGPRLLREQRNRRSVSMLGLIQRLTSYTSVICWAKSRFDVYNFLDIGQLLWRAAQPAWSVTHLAEVKNEIF